MRLKFWFLNSVFSCLILSCYHLRLFIASLSGSFWFVLWLFSTLNTFLCGRSFPFNRAQFCSIQLDNNSIFRFFPPLFRSDLCWWQHNLYVYKSKQAFFSHSIISFESLLYLFASLLFDLHFSGSFLLDIFLIPRFQQHSERWKICRKNRTNMNRCQNCT